MCNERADHDRRRCPAEHKRLFDAQVLKRMRLPLSGVRRSPPVTIPSDAQRHPNLHANLELFGAQGQEDRLPWRPRLQLWAKKYAVVMSGERAGARLQG